MSHESPPPLRPETEASVGGGESGRTKYPISGPAIVGLASTPRAFSEEDRQS